MPELYIEVNLERIDYRFGRHSRQGNPYRKQYVSLILCWGRGEGGDIRKNVRNEIKGFFIDLISVSYMDFIDKFCPS